MVWPRLVSVYSMATLLPRNVTSFHERLCSYKSQAVLTCICTDAATAATEWQFSTPFHIHINTSPDGLAMVGLPT